MILALWNGLGRPARMGLLAGATVVMVATVALGYWALRADYQILFTDLAPQDAAAMVAELDRLKVPYKLEGQGATILVDRELVYKTRIKLMGKELPLHGAVGLELFNNSDFGMTEFAQRINFQRALQGEITRTILALSEIQDVRVNIALPEQGLFRQPDSRGKAAITLTLKPGQVLRAEQVAGIQRLVSASVSGIAIPDVTIVDQHGVALTRTPGIEGEGQASSARLDLKKDTESYLAHKVGEVLERTFGSGQAMASVDVTLDMDRVNTTTEEVIPSPNRNGVLAGVVSRERESAKESGAPLDSRVADGGGGYRGGSTQREVDYALGRRVEQVVNQPGSIRRIQVVAVVRKPLDAAQIDQVRLMVSAAVGAVSQRGDAIIVQTLDASAQDSGDARLAGMSATDGVKKTTNSSEPFKFGGVWLMSALALILGVGIGLIVMLLRTSRKGAFAAPQTVSLSEQERGVILRQVRDWLKEDHSAGSNRDPIGRTRP